jgi:hypothetical protein
LRALLTWPGLEGAEGIDMRSLRARSIDRVADAIAEHLDIERIFARTIAAPIEAPVPINGSSSRRPAS